MSRRLLDFIECEPVRDRCQSSIFSTKFKSVIALEIVTWSLTMNWTKHAI